MVAKYVTTHDFKAVDRVKRDLLALYRKGIRKHAKKYAFRVERIYDSIAGQLSHRSLDKFKAKFTDYVGESYLLSVHDLMTRDGITFLPLYMTPLLPVGAVAGETRRRPRGQSFAQQGLSGEDVGS